MYMMLTLIDIKYVKYIYHYFEIEITNLHRPFPTIIRIIRIN